MSPYSPNVQGPAATRLTIGGLVVLCVVLLVLLGACFREKGVCGGSGGEGIRSAGSQPLHTPIHLRRP